MTTNLKLLAASLLGAASTLVLSGAAFADPLSGPYGSIGLGDSHFAPSGGATYNRFASNYGGALGWSFGNGLRTEFELDYGKTNIKRYSGSTSGKLHQFAYMANVLYDFDSVKLLGVITPHVGIGAGASTIHGQYSNAAVTGDVGGTRATFQGIAGIAIPLTQALNMDVDYRFMDTPNVSFKSSAGTEHGQLMQHTLFFDLRIDFMPPPAPTPAAAPAPAPTPAAAPAPAPEAQRAFQVFFDFNKSDITADAASIIAQAAKTAMAGHLTSIAVTGHTDTVGSVKYNLKLSERRAAAVKKELEADGVPTGGISTVGVGKSGLLVPTPDGVREPQNRRAEIVLQ